MQTAPIHPPRRMFVLDNNKNRMKDRPKSNPELREIEPKENADAGIINGKKIGLHHSGHEKTMGDEK